MQMRSRNSPRPEKRSTKMGTLFSCFLNVTTSFMILKPLGNVISALGNVKISKGKACCNDTLLALSRFLKEKHVVMIHSWQCQDF